MCILALITQVVNLITEPANQYSHYCIRLLLLVLHLHKLQYYSSISLYFCQTQSHIDAFLTLSFCPSDIFILLLK